jgi:hypothetical protein
MLDTFKDTITPEPWEYQAPRIDNNESLHMLESLHIPSGDTLEDVLERFDLDECSAADQIYKTYCIWGKYNGDTCNMTEGASKWYRRHCTAVKECVEHCHHGCVDTFIQVVGSEFFRGKYTCQLGHCRAKRQRSYIAMASIAERLIRSIVPLKA